jgi:type VI protein secretion system component VasF
MEDALYLRHHYGHFITEMLAVERREQAGEGPQEPGSIHARLQRLLQQAEAAAEADGHNKNRIEAASVAVLGWADARLLANNIRLTGGMTLQFRRFNRQTAGDDFFDQIKNLGHDDDLRDLHYLLLTLGYIGRYERPRSDLAELEAIRNSQRAALKAPPLDPRGLPAEPHLIEQPYLQAAPVAASVARRRPWLALVAALALLAPLPALWVPGGSALPPMAIQDDARASVARLVGASSCAAVTVDWDDGEQPSPTLRGYIGSETARDQLLQAVALVPGIGPAQDMLAVYPRPFCDFLELLAPYEEAGNQTPVRLGLAGGVQRLPLGSKVPLLINLPPVEGYVTLVHVNGRGDVLNLHPNEKREIILQPAAAKPSFASLLPPGQDLVLRRPAGTEMTFLIHTPTPLFNKARPLTEPAGDLLAALRIALKAQEAAGANAVAGHILFTSEQSGGPSGPSAGEQP